MDEQSFKLGVNYWPRRKAMYWWSDFDADEVREEFSILRDVGMDLARIFLLWDDWQPAPDQVDAAALDNLATVADIAAERGLSLDVTFFTGHMSGPNWAPRWLLEPDRPLPPHVRQLVSGGQIVNCGYRNPYVDTMALEAAELLVHAVVTRLKDHPGVGMWNLGNEPDLFAWPPTAADGRAWARRFTRLIHAIDPGRPVTCGLHVPSLTDDNHLRAHEIFAEVDVPAMHGYPMYAHWAAGPLDPDFVPFLCALTSALCGKPTLAEEFGGCTEAPGVESAVWEWTAYGQPRSQFMASETAFADYIEQVLPRLVDVGATGAVLWCYADYTPDLYSRPPCDESIHERFFGLVRPDGSLKPHAEVVRRFAATRPTVQPARHTVTLPVDPETYYQNPLHYAQQLYQQFRGERAADGNGR
jgi:endo-1,4-beta-mannosidase